MYHITLNNNNNNNNNYYLLLLKYLSTYPPNRK